MSDRRALILLILAFLGLRLAIPAILRPVGYVADWNDYQFFSGWARFSDRGLYPYLDFWMEHPPLFPYFVVAAYRIAAIIPPWQESLLTFSIIFGLLLLPFDIGNLLLVHRLARRAGGADASMLASWAYVLLFPPVFYWSAGFEVYPLFFLLLAAELAFRAADLGLRRWAVAAGVVAGIGIMVKLLPALALPAGAFALWKARRLPDAVIMVILALVTAAAIALPFAMANPVMARASAANILTRPAWETVFAVADGYFSGGAVAKPEDRLNPETATITDHETRVPSWPALFIGAALGGLALLRARPPYDGQSWTLALCLTTVIFFAVNKGYSPQFAVYLVAVTLVAWPTGRGIAYAAAISAVTLIEYPLALILFANQPFLIIGCIIVRTALLILIALDAARSLGAVSFPKPGRRFGFAASGILSIVTVVALGAASSQYAEARIAMDSQGGTIAALRAKPGITAIFSDTGLYDRLGSALRDRITVRLARENLPPRIPEDAAEVWTVYVDSEEGRRLAPAVQEAVRDRFLGESTTIDGVQLKQYLEGESLTPRTGGTLGNVILRSASVGSSARTTVPILLDWQNVPVGHKVFLHLLDEQGTLRSQRDLSLENGELRVVLPSDLPSGTYRVITGIYNETTGERLRGSSLDHIDLGQVQITR